MHGEMAKKEEVLADERNQAKIDLAVMEAQAKVNAAALEERLRI